MAVNPTPSICSNARATSLARRLVGGEGAATLMRYRIDPESCLEVAAHGLDSKGRILLAFSRHSGMGAPSTDVLEEVRVDIRLESPDPRVRILAATLHYLGVLQWIPEDERDGWANSPGIPEDVAAVIEAGGALAVVNINRVLVHDSAGVAPVSAIAMKNYPVSPLCGSGVMGSLEAHDAVLSFPNHELRAVITAVVEGLADGDVLDERPSHGGCEHTQDRVYCVDVDSTGITLMHIGPLGGMSRIVHVELPTAATVDDVQSTLAAAVSQTRSHRVHPRM
ncbi:hypothetical protein [Dermatophilus congolensis]|uniref:Uncharacterized protein n=1 Tax=Dermatophilus congolensis TaxID=1863 RepID=A0AA46H1I5_9MICO|nr:hypothetical protein [Dermatophilus congolensis]MBO3144000.1 hypothetical protein [Dermatophilus congolensis]MBO3152992.1 hypothetical protein [Dermatophilus congolensis]MBO3159995.1 hypothetical protein [Dermatophilus congolensis]MBO3164278.1 hypothetical protein [Dermatophilus congolensis]MBO3177826.1 hypothetical protein [Dermatophilus congolensis]